ncbi:hypothetical protein BGY98DRAFT_1101365 [Russula aff. rugulosa BPL654]|nr:hypothetical protein BGY98DRAFT_1101365 [Russula aff. rugulosa BPL654]
MFIIDEVVQEDHRMLLANELESITLRDTTTQVLCPAARVTVFEDFCLLGSGEHPQLQLEYLKTFALKLNESDQLPPVLAQGVSLLPFTHPRPVCEQLTSKHSHVYSIPSSYPYRNTSSLPLLLKTPSERSAFPLTLHGTCVVFLLLKRFSSEFETEAEVILMLLLELIHDETDAGEPRPGWMRVLAMEIMRGLCSDAEFMHSAWQRYDALATDGDTSPSIARPFTLLISALKRLVTSRPALLRVSAQILVAETLVMAASTPWHKTSPPRGSSSRVLLIASSSTQNTLQDATQDEIDAHRIHSLFCPHRPSPSPLSSRALGQRLSNTR